MLVAITLVTTAIWIIRPAILETVSLLPTTERSLTGHAGAVDAVTTADLDGRPVVISGGDDGTVRWDLTTGAAVGQPFSAHTLSAIVATADLDGRPVVISGSGEGTVRVWDLATGTAVGQPVTGHTGTVYAVTTADLDARPVVISSGDDGTVRVWDLATGIGY